LEFWKNDDTFRASIAQREDAEEWVFYDGPPFANGLPHYGHLLTGYAKDLFPRFQTMLGKKVDRVFGWDTHGLPAELEAMKQLGLTEKHEIEDMGIDVFNAKARVSVLAYTREGQEYGTRQARWGLRARLQDARPRLHGERAVGVQDALRQGPRL
ncbi:class I tRNA ligase family protein, partial [Microbacterium sp.]|uniref:class I tRNA ligase family protein n=1 Tax=Microbacterium sp. TaxID=51671 RepID=UPI003A950DCF